MQCKICGAETTPLHRAVILNKYEIQYYHCGQCGFTQTEEPYWLEEAYSDALSVSDTGVMSRNLVLSRMTLILIALLGKREGRFLDFGGGYGIFTRLMRDQGLDFYWYDKYATNLVARGFEGTIGDGQSYDAVTSFENFEHLHNPLEDIETMLRLGDTVIFSTELMPSSLPKPEKWWYYCLEHGQHISIFSKESLEFIAQKHGVNFVSDGRRFHMFTKKRVPKTIFLLSKILLKLGLDKWFKREPKTQADMYKMIEAMASR